MAVRGPDRLPGAAARGRRRSAGAVWLRRRRPPDLPGGRRSGSPGVRLHARRRRRGAGVRALAWGGVGGRVDRHAARAARRGADLRAGGRARARRAGGLRPRRDGRLRGHPHERHSVVRLRAAVGGARSALGRQPDAARRRRVARARRALPAAARRGHALPAGRGQRGARRPARRASAWCGGADGFRRHASERQAADPRRGSGRAQTPRASAAAPSAASS